MGLFAALFDTPEVRASSGTGSPAQWFADMIGGVPVASGETVNETSALTFTAVFAAVRIIAETVASLPLATYRRRADGGKDKLVTHSLYPIIHDAFNDDMTAIVGRETIQGHVLTGGNGYAEIVKDGYGDVVALWPIDPTRVIPKRLDQPPYSLYYEIDGHDVVAPGRILHIVGLGYDGIKGYSPIEKAKQAIGVGMAATKTAGSLFGNGIRASGIYSHPGKLGDDAVENLRKSLHEKHGGAENKHKTMILEEGLKWQQLTIPPEDAQFLETRVHSVRDVARIYRIPPHMLADLADATFSNIEHMGIEFAVQCIRPWLVRWEQEMKRKLIREKGVFVEHNMGGLLRGDSIARSTFYGAAIKDGWMSRNEARALENMNPEPELDIFLEPLNMAPAGSQEEGDEEDSRDEEVAAAHRPLMIDLFSRILRRTVGTWRKSAKRGEVPETDICDDHAERVIRIVTPAAVAHVVALGGERAYAEHITRKRAYIEPSTIRSLAGETNDLAEARAATELADNLLEELTHTESPHALAQA